MKFHVPLLLAGLILSLGNSVLATGAPQPDRVAQISRWLPATPSGLGDPIDNRATWDRFAKSDAAKKIIKQAEQLLKRPMPVITDDLFLEFSRNGNRSRCQHVISQKRGRLRCLVLAECLENRGRFLPAVEKTILSTCDEKTWVLPAHDSGLTNFKGKQITIDLRSSDVGWTLATIDYWLAKRLSPAVRKRIHDELERRVFRPFELMVTKGKPRMWWLTRTNNWNSVCLANVTGAALAGIESPDRRAFFVASAEKYIQYFLRSFTNGGYCSEGLGYWNYGFGHYVMLAEVVARATRGKLDLMAEPPVKRIAQFGHRMEIIPGVYPAFADCRPKSRPSSWIEWYCSRRFGFGWPVGRTKTLRFSGQGVVMLGLFSFTNSLVGRQSPEASLTQSLRDWFPDAGVLICRPAPGEEQPFGVALKGGNNAENHNHNDVGSFVVAVDGQTPLLDPGSEAYTRRTFSSRRYESGVLNSWGHPVPRVAGKLQSPGRSAAAKVLSTDFTDAADTLKLDLSAAYKVKTLEKLTREFVFSREGSGSLTVTDRVAFKTPKEFGTALITYGDWKRTGPNTLRVSVGSAAVEVQLDTGGAPFEIHAEEIHEDVHAPRLPTRIGIDLTDPVKQATVKMVIRPAE